MTFGHRIVAGIAACAVLGTGMALGSSPTARADWKGLTEVSHSRYVVSSDGSDVSVTTSGRPAAAATAAAAAMPSSHTVRFSADAGRWR